MNIFNIPPPRSGETGFLAGDLLFLAKGPAEGLPPFEHVAIVLRAQSANSADEIAHVDVYGLPDSLPNSSDRGIRGLKAVTVAGYWFNHRAYRAIEQGRLGDRTSGWNACWRVALTLDEQRYLESSSWMSVGIYKFRYEPNARVEMQGTDTVCTNCVGFVRWYYRHHFDLELVADYFDWYRAPFKDRGWRDFASPGHLARAADLPRSSLPYKPADRTQAELDARVLP